MGEFSGDLAKTFGELTVIFRTDFKEEINLLAKLLAEINIIDNSYTMCLRAYIDTGGWYVCLKNTKADDKIIDAYYEQHEGLDAVIGALDSIKRSLS